MTQSLLIEIGVEELPAIPLLNELKNIKSKWSKVLQNSALECEFDFYYTPRRLVLWHKSFPIKQSDSVEEMYGAPIAIAYKDGEPTKAAEGFARKCGVDLTEISKAQKGGKEVLYFKKEIKGQESKTLLEEMITTWINSLSFGKSMRWGSNKESFIRPIRWLNVMMDNDLVDVKLYDITSQNITYTHRMHSFKAHSITSPTQYFEVVKEGGVDLFDDSRKKNILDQFKTLESEQNISIEIDAELLDEVVAITEHPTALVGTFDEKFLRLPPEVIITSMKEHQRYFPVFQDGKLVNKFVVVSNALTDDFSKVTAGNETVLRPRLADALFFYDNDLKRGLILDGLEKVIFMNGLGTLTDKIERERKISQILFAVYRDRVEQSDSNAEDDLARAITLAKADLMSEMVYEFTELQGLMGYYYAKELGENSVVATAIKEQYLPDGEESALPSSVISAIVALSIKIDTLLGLFSINQIPTGSRDPFALRRAVLGIIKIVKKHNLPFDLNVTLKALAQNYEGIDFEKVENFILDRITQYYKVNPAVIKSVLETGERELLAIDAKINAVNNLVNSDEFSAISSTFKRLANITKDVDINSDLSIDTALFDSEAEKSLYNTFSTISAKKYESYEAELEALFSLKSELDSFFENVMVNVDDEAIKNNRKSLIALIYKELYKIADIKEITI